MQGKITDREAYPTIWILVVGYACGYLIWRFLLGQPPVLPCWFYQSLHIYCPACGGTRSVLALMQGKLFLSLYYHPLVPFVAVSAGAYLVSQTWWRCRGRKGAVLHYSNHWFRCAAMILLFHFVMRNVLWLGFQIPL